MTNKDIYEHFSKNVDDYDYVANKVVMKNDELHNKLVDSVPHDPDQKLNILDLGSGTGHGMYLILQKFPKARVTGVDFSHNMISMAKEKLEGFKDRIQLIEKNFNEIDLKEKYDAIVSVIAIHNSTHEQKNELFRKIYDSLKDNGVFVNGDFVEGETSDEDNLLKKQYRNYLVKHLSGDELKAWLQHVFKEDMPMKLSQQFEILKSHFFKDLEPVWQYNNEILYKARKYE